MKTTIDLFTYSCVGCGKCIRVCSKDVLKLVDNGKIRFINVAHGEKVSDNQMKFIRNYANEVILYLKQQ